MGDVLVDIDNSDTQRFMMESGSVRNGLFAVKEIAIYVCWGVR